MPGDSRPSRGAICSDRDRAELVMDPHLLDHCSLGGSLRQKSSMRKMARRATGMVMDTEVWTMIEVPARESNPPV